MNSPQVIALRASVMIVLLASMPLLVLPPVVAQIDKLLYPIDVSQLPAQRPGTLLVAGAVDLPQQPPPEHVQPLADSSPRNAPSSPRNETSPRRNDARPLPGDGDDLDSRIESARSRLEQLGATYMLLEARGQPRRVFHFHCRMPVDEGRVYQRPFDASASDPAVAMEQVVAAVEAWRAPTPAVQTAERPENWK